MKIGYVIETGTLGSGRYSGVLQQALAYREALSLQGVNVDLLNPWEGTRLGEYDLIHVFGGGDGVAFLLKQIGVNKTKYIFSPIVDSTTANGVYRMYSYLGWRRMTLMSNGYINRNIAERANETWVRSADEESKIIHGLGIKRENVRRIPVCLRIAPELLIRNEIREEACLHVSSYFNPHKNVMRLAEATQRAGIKLYLGGNVPEKHHRQEWYQKLLKMEHVHILGRLGDQELIEYYGRVKVFALPSLYEGVGLVALEAGISGAGVVITQQGGPPDYFGGEAYYVDPYSTGSIQHALSAAMEKPNQPALREHLLKHYTQLPVGAQILDAYEAVLGG